MRRAVVVLLGLCTLGRAESEHACTCQEGNACYEALGCPKKTPADPSPCPAVRAGLPTKMWVIPKGLGEGYRAANMKAFLLRHAHSWRIQCSECAYNTKEDTPRPEHADILPALEAMRAIGGKYIEVAASPNYVFVTDIRQLKVATDRGGARIADQHELLHLYLQRAEQARKDFVDVFGEPRFVRSAMILVKREGDRRKFSQNQLGNADTNLLYGGGTGKLVGGMCGNGFILSGRDDDTLHFNCRHMIGHLCISTYHTSGVHAKHLPQWIFRGAAHWLCKLHPRAVDHAYYCSYEGVEVSGSGTNWDDKARKIAARGPQRDPVEAMLQAATAKQMDYSMHVRAWSWFDIFTTEDREPFVQFVQRLRSAQEARVAAKEAFGQAPEYVDDRWRERVQGRRRDVTASNREQENEVDADAATARELRGIANENDIQLLAGKIRGLERCQNVRTARLLVSLIDSRDSDRVREVIALILARTTDEPVLEYLRGDGFERAGKLGKATLVRVFGEIKHEPARELLRSALDDGFWLVRANATRALAQLGDSESIAKLGEMAGKDSQAKVRIGAMDALGAFGDAAKGTLPLWERNLMDRHWQVKVATCAAYRAIGSPDAVDSLIGRLDSEGGRVHDEIRRSLKALTGVDKDWSGQTWLKWWAKAKRFAEAERKMREQLAEEGQEPTPKKDSNDRYASQKKPPTYYGIKIYARAVGYVLDISQSMEQGFRASEAMQERLGRKYTASTRIGVCREELQQAIQELDPRTRLNVVFFNTRVRVWKDTPQVASDSTKDSAISAIRNAQPDGQTNYYDALRTILQMGEATGGWSSSFADTPDTLFFLTDGTPTDGEITKSDELLSWFSERNRFARLRVHVVAMGTTGVDLEFLRGLAERNDGTFLHLTGDY